MHRNNTYRFKTNAFFGGNLLIGDVIEISKQHITLSRRRCFFRPFYCITIPISNIVGVEIHKIHSGAEILVKSYSKNHFVSKGYSFSNALKIKRLLLS